MTYNVQHIVSSVKCSSDDLCENVCVSSNNASEISEPVINIGNNNYHIPPTSMLENCNGSSIKQNKTHTFLCQECLLKPGTSARLKCNHLTHTFDTSYYQQDILQSNPEAATENTYSRKSSCLINDLQNKLKVGSLNVCGLKRCINYQKLVNFIKEYDIFCVQETKLDTFDIISISEVYL